MNYVSFIIWPCATSQEQWGTVVLSTTTPNSNEQTDEVDTLRWRADRYWPNWMWRLEKKKKERIQVYLNKNAVCEVPKSDSAICWARVDLQVVGGFEQHACHQVGVSPQIVDALLCGGAEHLHTLSWGAQQEPRIIGYDRLPEVYFTTTSVNHADIPVFNHVFLSLQLWPLFLLLCYVLWPVATSVKVHYCHLLC